MIFGLFITDYAWFGRGGSLVVTDTEYRLRQMIRLKHPSETYRGEEPEHLSGVKIRDPAWRTWEFLNILVKNFGTALLSYCQLLQCADTETWVAASKHGNDEYPIRSGTQFSFNNFFQEE